MATKTTVYLSDADSATTPGKNAPKITSTPAGDGTVTVAIAGLDEKLADALARVLVGIVGAEKSTKTEGDGETELSASETAALDRWAETGAWS